MQTKKFLAVILAIVLMIGMLPMHSFAAATDVVITNHVAGNFYFEYYHATQGLSQVTSITVSGGEFTQLDWGNLQAINSPSTVTTVDLSGTTMTSTSGMPDYTLSNFSGLTTVYLPSGTYSIVKGTFSGCTSLTAITIPSGVTSIGAYTFSHCTKLSSVTFSGTPTITSIQEGAFKNCASLTDITIPEGVTSIGANTFDGCTSLSSVTFSGTPAITSLGDSAFKNCASLTGIAISAGVTSIGVNAFDGCTSLTDITIPSGVTSIGNYLFNGCTSLASVTIPTNVTSIGNYSFNGCKKLTSITIPEKVTSIGNYAFYGCTGFTSITIPEKVTSIGNYAFYGCTGFTSITIPASVTSIGSFSFNGCTSLASITMGSSTPISIDYSVFAGTAQYAAIYVPVGSENAWDLSDGTEDLQLNGLRLENLPPWVTNYSANRISDTEVQISIASNEPGVCYYSIAKAGDPAPAIDTSGSGTPLVNSYGSLAATIQYTNLTAGAYKLYVQTKDSLGNIAVTPYVFDIEAYVPPTDIVISNHVDGNFSSELLSAMSSAGIPDTPYVHYNGIKNLTVSGGTFNDADWQALYDANNNTYDTYDNSICMSNVQTIDLSGTSSTSYVPDYTFGGFSALQHIFWPSGGVTGLGSAVFSNCKSLTSITIPASVTSMGDRVFEDCKSLTSITIPASVTSMGETEFADCTSLASITFLATTPPAFVSQGSSYTAPMAQNGIVYVPNGSVAAYRSSYVISRLPSSWTVAPLTCTVSFDSQGGSPVASINNVNNGSTITEPSAPTLPGYSFGGWYKEAACTNAWNFITDTITTDITLYAKWTGNRPVITTTSLPNGTVGVPYSQTLAATSGTTVIWSVYSGSLPTGLTLNPATGTIFGTPTAAGTTSFTVQATVYAGSSKQALNITIGTTPPTVTGVTVSPAAAAVQKGNTQAFTATVGGTNTPPQTVTWSVYGNSSGGTSINGSGLLTVAADETASTVTVKATSVYDISKSGTATVIVIITAPVTTYTVTASVCSGGNISPNGVVSVPAGGSQTFTIIPGSGYRISSVTVDGVNQGAIATYTFTNITANHTINAAFTITSSSGGGYSSGGGSAAPAYNADVNSNNGSNSTLPVTVDKNSNNAVITVGPGNSLVPSGGTTVITAPPVPDVHSYTLSIPVPSLSTPGAQGSLAFNTGAGSLTVPSNMLTGIPGMSGSDVRISIGQGDNPGLPGGVRGAIGDRPLVQLTLSIDGKQTVWNNPGAPVRVSIPYAPPPVERASPESIIVYYIADGGRLVPVPSGHYSPATGTVPFTTTHFSYYAVGYNKVNFNDVSADAWYNKAVAFISARGITTGTGSGNFSPDTELTRGDFLVMLMKSYGIDADTNPVDNFSDAGNAYYTGYLAAAKRLGISAGVGNNTFAPNNEITRQEMFTLLYNALKTLGKLPQGNLGKKFSDFSDTERIDSWAKEAMTLLVQTGTIGGNGGKLDPTSTTTRAEMAQVLYNLLSK